MLANSRIFIFICVRSSVKRLIFCNVRVSRIYQIGISCIFPINSYNMVFLLLRPHWFGHGIRVSVLICLSDRPKLLLISDQYVLCSGFVVINNLPGILSSVRFPCAIYDRLRLQLRPLCRKRRRQHIVMLFAVGQIILRGLFLSTIRSAVRIYELPHAELVRVHVIGHHRLVRRVLRTDHIELVAVVDVDRICFLIIKNRISILRYGCKRTGKSGREIPHLLSLQSDLAHQLVLRVQTVSKLRSVCRHCFSLSKLLRHVVF